MYGCASAPYTGRSQLILISEDQERSLGFSAYQSLVKKEKVVRGTAASEMLERVGSRIAAAADRPDYDWEFVLIENDQVANAFALPGGKVFVYTGILEYTKNEAGLATVVGHEIAHVLARHGAERMSIGLLSQIGETALVAAVNSQSPTAVRAFQSAYGIAANIGVILPYSRQQEYEADRIGLILMAKAGYDPHAALDFWERMSRSAQGPKPPPFLSTHPTDEARIKKIQGLLPEALSYYSR